MCQGGDSFWRIFWYIWACFDIEEFKSLSGKAYYKPHHLCNQPTKSDGWTNLDLSFFSPDQKNAIFRCHWVFTTIMYLLPNHTAVKYSSQRDMYLGYVLWFLDYLLYIFCNVEETTEKNQLVQAHRMHNNYEMLLIFLFSPLEFRLTRNIFKVAFVYPIYKCLLPGLVVHVATYVQGQINNIMGLVLRILASLWAQFMKHIA